MRCACGPALVSVGREGAPSHLQARDFAHRMEVFGSRRSLEAHCQVCRSCGGCAATNVPLSPSGTWLPGVAWTCNLFPSNTRGVMDNQKLRVEFKIMQQKLSFVYFVPGTHVTCATSLFPKRLIGTRPWGDLDAPSGPCLTGQMPGGPRPVAQRCVLTRACAGGVASRLVISWGGEAAVLLGLRPLAGPEPVPSRPAPWVGVPSDFCRVALLDIMWRPSLRSWNLPFRPQ